MGIAEMFNLEKPAAGLAFDEWTDDEIVDWIRDSVDLADGNDPTFEAVRAEMNRRGLKLY